MSKSNQVTEIEERINQGIATHLSSLGHTDPILDHRITNSYNIGVSLWSLGLNVVATDLKEKKPLPFLFPSSKPGMESYNQRCKFDFSYAEYCNGRRQTLQEVHDQFLTLNDKNIAVCCGKNNDQDRVSLIVVDADNEEAVEWCQEHLPSTPVRIKTRRGMHFWYRYPDVEERFRNSVEVKIEGHPTVKVDVKTNGLSTFAGSRFYDGDGLYSYCGNSTIDQDLPKIPYYDNSILNIPSVSETRSAQTVTPVDLSAYGSDEKVRRARAYLSKVPGAVEGAGGDQHTFTAACKIVRGFGFESEEDLSLAFSLLKEWNQKCDPPWDDFDLEQKIWNAQRYGTENYGNLLERKGARNGYGCVEDFLLDLQARKIPDADERSKIKDIGTLAYCYLVEKGFYNLELATRTLVSHNESLYKYDWSKGIYVKKKDVQLRLDLTAWMEKFSSFTASSSCLRLKSHLLESINAKIPIADGPESAFFLEPCDVDAKDVVPLENGLFDLKAFLKGRECLYDHDPIFFHTANLPFAFDPNRVYPTPEFDKILNFALPDKEDQEMVQMFFGSCLIPRLFEEMLLFHGDGDNGKTALVVAIKTMLGHNNLSNATLECFHPDRSCRLVGLIGKKLNVCEEMSRVGYATEQILKRYTSGLPITYDGKYKNEAEFIPTAKLFFNTNTLPAWVDNSRGLWRRLIVLPFKNKVPEEEKDIKYITPDWWRQTGELPGIFAWCLEGLRKFVTNGYRTKISPTAKIATERCRVESNSSLLFLEEHCEFRMDGCSGTVESVPANLLYELYQDYCKHSGMKPKGKIQFNKDVASHFGATTKVRASQRHEFNRFYALARGMRDFAINFSKPGEEEIRPYVWEGVTVTSTDW